MKIVILSDPLSFEKEHDFVNALFQKGLNCFHIRKPQASANEVEALLKKLKSSFLRRVHIHAHFHLIEKYNLGGVHFPESMRHHNEVSGLIKIAKQRNLQVSTSIHENSDITGISLYDYVFLSPIFDSISKDGYKGIAPEKVQHLLNSLKRNNKTKVIALGGIEAGKIQDLSAWAFDGLACMGCIWKNPENAVAHFLSMQKEIQQLPKVLQ